MLLQLLHPSRPVRLLIEKRARNFALRTVQPRRAPLLCWSKQSGAIHITPGRTNTCKSTPEHARNRRWNGYKSLRAGGAAKAHTHTKKDGSSNLPNSCVQPLSQITWDGCFCYFWPHRSAGSDQAERESLHRWPHPRRQINMLRLYLSYRLIISQFATSGVQRKYE